MSVARVGFASAVFLGLVGVPLGLMYAVGKVLQWLGSFAIVVAWGPVVLFGAIVVCLVVVLVLLALMAWEATA